MYTSRGVERSTCRLSARRMTQPVTAVYTDQTSSMRQDCDQPAHTPGSSQSRNSELRS